MKAPRVRLIAKTVIATLIALGAFGAVACYAVLISGIYNVSATSQHLQFVYDILEKGMHQSVRFHAKRIVSPQQLTDDHMIERGARLYHAHCVQCHGAPGVAPEGIGMGMQPVPGPLVDATGKWRPNELYWIVRHGIKMSGMPAWEYRLPDEEIWQIVAFVGHMPELTPDEYKKLTASRKQATARALALNDGAQR